MEFIFSFVAAKQNKMRTVLFSKINKRCAARTSTIRRKYLRRDKCTLYSFQFPKWTELLMGKLLSDCHPFLFAVYGFVFIFRPTTTLMMTTMTTTSLTLSYSLVWLVFRTMRCCRHNSIINSVYVCEYMCVYTDIIHMYYIYRYYKYYLAK